MTDVMYGYLRLPPTGRRHRTITHSTLEDGPVC